MKIVAHMVTRDEGDRYLPNVLARLNGLVDEILVYDDRSTDTTPDILRDAGVTYTIRPEHLEGFADHEGRFRQAAWEWMVHAANPRWVLAIDADELVVAGTAADPIRQAAQSLPQGAQVRIHEVWAANPEPHVRVDGWWGSITGVRFVPRTATTRFADRPTGCGSVPESHLADPAHTDAFSIAHLGYLNPADRIAKQARYTGRRGHSPKHVASITDPNPILDPRPDLLGLVGDLRPTH